MSILHTKEQGLRVHGLANLGGLVAIAGLEETPPDLLLGVFMEVADRLPHMKTSRIAEMARRGGDRLHERKAEKRAWNTRKKMLDLQRVDLTNDQIRLLVQALGGTPPPQPSDLLPALSEELERRLAKPSRSAPTARKGFR